MIRYRYDGTYEGLLNMLEFAQKHPQKPTEIIRDLEDLGTLFDGFETVTILSDEAEARGYSNELRRKLGDMAVNNLFFAHLAEGAGVSYLLYEYITYGLQEAGRNLSRDLSHPLVHQVQKLRIQVLREKERMLGMVRFSLLSSGIYYSKVSPDHRMLGLLGRHFAERFQSDRWMIHDIRRGWALLGQAGKYHVISLPKEEAPIEDDEFIQNLWRQYHGHVAILERLNPKLQKGYMPRRYWQNLVEKPGEAMKVQEATYLKYRKDHK